METFLCKTKKQVIEEHSLYIKDKLGRLLPCTQWSAIKWRTGGRVVYVGMSG